VFAQDRAEPQGCPYKTWRSKAVDEEKEKKLASLFGDMVDGNPPAGFQDAELLEAMEAAAIISGALGDTPELNPVFSDTLRARLVRETRKKAAPARAARSSTPKRVWYQLAAATFFLFFVPTLFVLRDVHYKYKLDLIEKYDKMYVPFSQQLAKNDYLGNSLKPFGGSHAAEKRKMAFDLHKTGEDAYFFKSYRLK
jgi:hypothetical protein